MYNLSSMDRLFLFGLAVLPFLAGCIPVPVGSEHPPELVSQPTLDSLIGEDKRSILGLLGRPDAVFSNEASSYFVYGAYGSEKQVLLMVWVPIFAQKYSDGRLFCVLLEFNKENIFRRYRINDYSRNWSDLCSCLSPFVLLF